MTTYDKPMTIPEIYSSGELTMSEVKKIKDKFVLHCKFCKKSNISIMVEGDDDGCCETCTSPYARFTIKCKDCGQGISVRD